MTVEVTRARFLKDVPHGFLGRRGGVSKGLCAGLNVGLGSGDEREAIQANRRLAVEAVAPGRRLATLHQVHSPTAIAVTEPYPDDARPHADALATDRPGLALGILTADCTPVLFADPAAGVIGAAHAGWKGAIGGVIAATVATMEALGARRGGIVAAIGPLIRKESYEVGNEFVERFIEADAEHGMFFMPGERDGHAMFDLAGFIRMRLENAGVLMIDDLGIDTYADERCFSYRRSVHRKEADYGRLVHAIALEG